MLQDARFVRAPLAIALAAALYLPMAAMAQDSSQPSEAEQAEAQLDRIVVTGSRIKRAEIEGPAPVTVITREDMEREGFTTVFDALTTLTQATGSVQNDLFQGFTANASVLNLRGLGPGRTLVLINGRRAADYPLPYNGQSNFTNLSQIPSAAVERIEVLAGGASAIYGSDAVAGVINVVLIKGYEGNAVSVRVGTTTEGGGDSQRAQWVGGFSGENWNITYAAEYLNRDPLYGFDRDFMDSRLDNPVESRRTAGLALVYIDLLDGGRSVYPGDEVCSRFENLVPAESASRGQYCGQFNDVGLSTIRNADENMSAYVYGDYVFDNGIEMDASLSVFDSQALLTSQPFWFGDIDAGALFDANLGTLAILQRFIQPSEVGGLDQFNETFDERAIDASFGFRGMFGDSYDWEAVVSHSEYEVRSKARRFLKENVNNYFQGEVLGTVSGFPIHAIDLDNFFTPMTPDTYRSLTTDVPVDGDSSSTLANFVVTGDLFEMPAGPLSFAALAEFGTQDYSLRPDPRLLPDRQEIWGYTFTGGGGERDRYAFGTEFSIPLHSTLTATVAGRYDKYDDVTNVDDAITWNAGIEWRPLDNLLVRGSYATSFRAPDMHYIFAGPSGFFVSVADEYLCRRDGISVEDCGVDGDPAYTANPAGRQQGNPNLKEEEGDSYTFGFVWDITDNLNMSVDYYNIELEDEVDSLDIGYILRHEASCRLGTDRDGSSVDTGSAFCADILARVERLSAPGTEFDEEIELITTGFINRAVTRTDGIDATMSYNLDTDNAGQFRYELSYSHTLGQETAEFAEDPLRDYRDDLQNFDFRSRMRGSISWERQDWSATLAGFRYGSLPNWEETGRIAPYMFYNLTVGYQVDNHWKVSLITENLFNKFAPRDDSFFTYPYFWRAFSPVGREVFLQVDYEF